MRKIFSPCSAFLLLLSLQVNELQAQRPATAAETAEDARVLKIISQAMPKEVDGAPEPSERSFGISNLNGTTGFYNDRNFVSRDAFEHQYTISYQFTKAPEALKEKIEAAKNSNNLEYLYALSNCQVEVYVNSGFTMPYALAPLKKITSAFCPVVYRDATESTGTFMFFGNWTIKPAISDGDDMNGKPEQRYSLVAKPTLHPGTAIQTIAVYVNGHSDVADLIMKQINWQQIRGLLGTGKYQDENHESDLKKYFVEKPVSPAPGINSLSFTYVDAAGKEQLFSISSVRHDLSNCALLRNHNENPKILQEAHIDFRIQDDKDKNKLFTISLPIIRTTGSVTATYQSDYDYQVMWRGNPDPNHSFTADNIKIDLLKWAPVGDFIEGSFSGTATIHDHNDFSTEKPAYTIKNGKFRIRRIADEMR